uniref:NADH-ubiquinone oxidoreductase chain 4 n=1 Tax=Perinereis cultrifera TaxID=59559 RepID=A0A7G8JTL3_PERCL|nr:NADH dehydrogenase subunit 4 [Perinereis cultrifera]QNJ33911.1 NADH dehydrogenase subunit 4 [Perinereis cultrifera]
MLTILFPLLLLPLTSFKWNNVMLYTSSLILPTMLYMYCNSIPINLSPMIHIDAMSAVLIMLTMWITPLIIAASQNIKKNSLSARFFLFNIIILTIILLLAFSASHMFSFYILFEASLIPTLLVIMKWGYQPERLHASMYLMLYTISASLPLLAGIAIHSSQWFSYHLSFSLYSFPRYSSLIWFAMNLAFLVKLPLFTFHLWLPKAHVEAPVAGSMILAAVLLKLGGYGMLRVIYMTPPITVSLKMFLLGLSLWGGMVTSLICVRQQDIKSLIAYSSVGHMSLVIAGILANIQWGLWGAIAMMISHGLLSSALFAAADMCYSASNSRSLLMNKGLNIAIPSMSMLWFVMCAANMAAPPSFNLMAEIMLISSAAITTKLALAPLGLMSFVAAGYSLILYVSLNHGSLNTLHNPSLVILPRNLLIIMGHIAPIILIMLSPSFIIMW